MVVDKHQPEGVAGGSAPTQNQAGMVGVKKAKVMTAFRLKCLVSARPAMTCASQNQPDGQTLEQAL